MTPAWSPDGSRLLLERDVDGRLDLYTVAPDGSALQRLTNDAAREHQGSWSPDGRQILFLRVEAGTGPTEHWAIGVDGSNPVLLAPDALGADWQPLPAGR
jgi:Tol biopolymer transport system component